MGYIMVILKITDNPDGSANVLLDLSEEEIMTLVEKGFVTLIKEYIERKEDNAE